MNCRKNSAEVPEVTVKDGETNLPGIAGNVTELCFEMTLQDANKAGVKLFCSTEHETVLYYDRKKGQIVFDRTRGGQELSGREKDVNVRVCSIKEEETIRFDIFLDVTSIEAFINDGAYVMTGNVYPDPSKAAGIRFFAEGGSALFRRIRKYDIV